MKLIATIICAAMLIAIQPEVNWPPDPKLIFGSDVEVLSVEAHDVTPVAPMTDTPIMATPTANVPSYTYDNFPAPLPEGYRWDVPTQPISSPDGQYIILFGGKFREVAHALLFTVATGQFDDLGAPTALYKATWEWRDNHTLLLFGQGIYHDALYTNALTIIETDHKYMWTFPTATYPHNPVYPQDNNVIGVFNIWQSTPPICRWYVFDFVRHIPITYDYRALCNIEYGDLFGDGYYREVSPNHKQATLVRYNPTTFKREELYTGEIEHISWIKDDYAALMFDDSGYVDALPDSTEKFGVMVAHPTLNIIRLSTRQILYTTAADWGDPTSIWRPDAYFFKPDWLQISRAYLPPDTNDKPQPNSLIHLQGESATEVRIDGTLSDSLGNDWYLLLPTGLYQFLTSVRLYNLTTAQTIPVVDVSALPFATIGIVHLSANEFKVTVQQASIENAYQPLHEAIYTLRIKGVELG